MFCYFFKKVLLRQIICLSKRSFLKFLCRFPGWEALEGLYTGYVSNRLIEMELGGEESEKDKMREERGEKKMRDHGTETREAQQSDIASLSVQVTYNHTKTEDDQTGAFFRR